MKRFSPLSRASIFATGLLLVSCGDDSTDNSAVEEGNAVAAKVDTAGSSVKVSAGEPLSFNKHIQPILSEHCYHCHGPDSGTREPKDSPLRLDTVEGAFAEREDGKQPIVKGDVAASNMITRIKLDPTDPLSMPPPGPHQKTLSPEKVALLERWINEGAPYEKHWSFMAPTKQEATALKTIPQEWVKNPIDSYTAAAMEEHGLTPNPASEPARLIRRLTLDITGLPPHPDDVEKFLKAHAEDEDAAVTAAVDRLISSDGYAENMTRHWLDAIRYADTHGIHIDNTRNVWPYRDWVIRAFHENMPFDQFTIEQVAGDLLPNATLDQKVATGFGRALPTTGEGGAIREEYEAIYAQDRTDTTAAIYLGLTMGCAACHDHKFDPITQRDNFAFNAFFRNTTMDAMDGNNANHAPSIFVPRHEDRAEWSRLHKELRANDAAIAARKKEARDEALAWMSTADPATLAATAKSPEFAMSLITKDGAVTADVKGEIKTFPVAKTLTSEAGEAVVVEKAFEIGEVGAFDADEKVTYGIDVHLSKNLNGALASKIDTGQNYRGWDIWLEGDKIGTHIVDRWPDQAIKAVSREALKLNEWNNVVFTYDGTAPANKSVKIYINGKSVPVVYQRSGKVSDLTTEQPFRIGARRPGANVPKGAAIHSFRFHRGLLSEDDINDKLGDAVAVLQKTEADLSPEEIDRVVSYWMKHLDPVRKKLGDERNVITQKIGKLREQGSRSLVMQEKADSEPHAYVLIRGEYSNKDMEIGKIPADVPGVLPAMPADAPRNRLGLAHWLVSEENPLTARVNMNRFWYYFFGQGLVSSNADFGIMGARPSHPKLLDYLAVEFVESGWDMKHMVKLITTSATYRQSQQISPEKKEIDGANTWLARGPRYRLDAEQIRDTALFAAGLLSQKIGGPPVKPYQPKGVWEAVAMPQSNTRFYHQDKGEKLYRRSLYSFWKRTAPMANMEILNAPSREVFCVQRDRTNTPLQAFVTLNDVQFVEASRHLAEQAMLASGDFDERIDHITHALLAREFSAEEKEIVREILDSNLAHYREDKSAAKELVELGETKADLDKLELSELAAWTITSSKVFNLDETLNK